MIKTDIVVIGAGVVGIATALKIREKFPTRDILILERKSEFFSETSRFNSGVIHSGIHQQANLLRSKLARRGVPMLIDFCKREEVLHRKCGMVISVCDKDFLGLWKETNSLWLLYKNSRKQNINLEWLSASEIRRLEPNVKSLFGIYMPDIWIIDQMSLGEKMFAMAKKKGIGFIFNANLSFVGRFNGFYRLTVNNSIINSGVVINCAGVRADEVAALAGYKNYEVFPYRGEYYEVVGSKRDLIKSTLVYPALRPGSPIKGVHLTKSADGRLLIGPNASSWVNKDDNFSVQSPMDEFLKAAKKFLPDLEEKDLKWAYSGLRAKVNKGVGEEDFIIKKEAEDPTFINLIGIESPGFTASFAIGEYVAKMVK